MRRQRPLGGLWRFHFPTIPPHPPPSPASTAAIGCPVAEVSFRPRRRSVIPTPLPREGVILARRVRISVFAVACHSYLLSLVILSAAKNPRICCCLCLCLCPCLCPCPCPCPYPCPSPSPLPLPLPLPFAFASALAFPAIAVNPSTRCKTLHLPHPKQHLSPKNMA